MIDPLRNPKNYRNDSEWNEAVSHASGIVKLVCGVCNNATFLVLMDALEGLKTHPQYRGKAKMWFKDAIKEWKNYEWELLHSKKNGFFDLTNFLPSVREIYGDITNSDYFEYWQGTGSRTYMTTKPLVTSLVNKYKLSFEDDGMKYPTEVAWAMTGLTCLQVCCKFWENSVGQASNDYGIPMEFCKRFYKPFLVEKPMKSWKIALSYLEPSIEDKIPEKHEKNIAFGIRQLYDEWSSPHGIYDNSADATEEFSELFKSKRIAKLAAQSAREYARDMEEVVKKDNIEKLKNKILRQ